MCDYSDTTGQKEEYFCELFMYLQRRSWLHLAELLG